MASKFNDNFIYNVSEKEKEAIVKLDSIDDTIWGVLVDLNEHFTIGVNFNEIEHTPLSIEAREALLEVLESFK